MLLDAGTQKEITLTSGPYRDTDPEFSADGKGVFFARYAIDGSNSSIMRVNTDGTGMVNLSAANAGGVATADSQPRVSPDGSQVAFVTLAGAGFQIAVMNVDGTMPQLVTDDPGVDSAPAWSPDGSNLVYLSSQATGNDDSAPKTTYIELVQLASGRFWQLLGSQSYLGSPTFSPDGGQIMYTSIAPGNTADVFVMNSDGSGVHDVQPTLLTSEQEVDWR